MVKMPAGPNAFFDIDDTVIPWDDRKGEEFNLPSFTVNCRGIVTKFFYNPHNLNYLKKLAVRGHAIVVWSAGGSDWAEAVVKGLGIEELVWAVASKPTYYIDDIKDPTKFMGRYEFYELDGTRVKHEDLEKK